MQHSKTSKKQNRTKIVATIGPSSGAVQVLEKMLISGMDVARLNFSHGTHNDHKKLIQSIKDAAKNLGKDITIIQDLQGPRVRVGDIAAMETRAKDEAVFPILPSNAAKYVKPGQIVLIEDGKIECIVKKRIGAKLYVEIIKGGVLKPHKGINLPGARIDLPAVTLKDKKDVEFGVKMGVDYIVLSFVKSDEDIKSIKEIVARNFKNKRGASRFMTHPGIIAKIETAEAVKNIKAIAKSADGVMIGRGDLGLQVSLFKLPEIQKNIIHVCRNLAKPVIVATQMLETMVTSDNPTRAEISDIGNAVFDGTDAVMLSGETAGGKYPVEAVRVMNETISEAEKSHYDDVPLRSLPHDIGYKARAASLKFKAKCIVIDDDIEAVSLVSRARPEIPIYVHATERPELLRQFNLFWGVFPNPKEEHIKKPVVYIEDGGVRIER